MKMTDPLYSIWEALPEPVKASVLSIVLGVTMALKKDSRTWKEKAIDIVAGAVIVYIAGLVVQMFGLSDGWAFVAAGAIGGFGVGKVQAWAAKYIEKKVDNAD